MLELNINEAFWDRGDFPAVVQNGSEVVALENPWVNGTNAAPFDQRMLLALLHIRTAHLWIQGSILFWMLVLGVQTDGFPMDQKSLGWMAL